jgi:hypothetical protein
MLRPRLVVPLLAVSLASGGCVAGLAASAIGAAARSAQGQPQSNAALKPQATQACTAHASQYGTVHIIDVEQRAINRLIVWGTATSGTTRRSFECAFTTKIVGFKLRAI